MSDTDEYITIDELFNQSDVNEQLNHYSNFNDVIQEDKINTEIDKDKFFYQPQFKDNCELKVVGYNDDGKKPMIKIGEFTLLNDKWIIIAHLYNIDDVESFCDNKVNCVDVFSIILNKNNTDIIMSLVYKINKINSKYNYSGNFNIMFKYKDTKKEDIIKIRELDSFSGINKSIELLINELTNSKIMDNYEW
jgi:hypothetical protein